MATTRPEQTKRGVFLIVVAVFLMSIQDSLFKHFSNDISLWQIFSLRGLLALPILLIVAIAIGSRRNLWLSAMTRWPLLRSLFLTLMFLAMYASMPFLSLSTIAAGIYTCPVFVTLLSAYAIGEPVGVRGWVAVTMGFGGVLIILQPGTDVFTYWALLPVLGGFFYALSNVTTRSKCQSITPAAMALSLNVALLTTGLVLSAVMLSWSPSDDIVRSYPSLLGTWSHINMTRWLLIGCLAVFVVAIALALAGAYQSARPSIVATFDYSYLIFVALWDYLFFTTSPTTASIVGMTMIASAGFLALHRREASIPR